MEKRNWIIHTGLWISWWFNPFFPEPRGFIWLLGLSSKTWGAELGAESRGWFLGTRKELRPFWPFDYDIFIFQHEETKCQYVVPFQIRTGGVNRKALTMCLWFQIRQLNIPGLHVFGCMYLILLGFSDINTNGSEMYIHTRIFGALGDNQLT